MSKTLKSIMGRASYAVQGQRLLGNRGMIVLFHRVDDRLKDDPISCGVEEFRAYCAFFKRHFEVIDLTEMLARIERRQSLHNTLSITFDDGYLDNSQAAAPILKEFGLPATFFIASGFIGSQHVTWWDEHLPFRPEWMTWDHVRQLHKDGFSIGGHTDTHVDLGKVDIATADREIRACKNRLEVELGSTISLFSFPYGRRDNIRPETLALVEAAGFGSCVSAFGGLAAPGDNLFQVQREAISPWYKTPYQFGFEMTRLHGLRTSGTRPSDNPSGSLPDK
jgi:peptidoglycan/xylan/chitin deacetylase (PgdA/CDA1 family)